MRIRDWFCTTLLCCAESKVFRIFLLGCLFILLGIYFSLLLGPGPSISITCSQRIR